MDLDAIHRALADQIRGYIADDWNVAPYPMSSMEFDRIEIWPAADYVGYWATFGANGNADVIVEVRVEVAGNEPESVFQKITRALSVGSAHGTSIVDAIHSDTTLGGNVSTVRAMSAQWDVMSDGYGARGVIPVEIVVAKSGAQV